METHSGDQVFINPRPACAAGFTVVSLCVCVCLSTYLVCKAKVRRYHKLLWFFMEFCRYANVWLSLKMQGRTQNFGRGVCGLPLDKSILK